MLTFSRWPDFARLWNTFIHCFVERDVFLFTATDLSSCISWLDTIGNHKTSTSLVASEVVVLFSLFVSVFLCFCFLRQQMVKKYGENNRQNQEFYTNSDSDSDRNLELII